VIGLCLEGYSIHSILGRGPVGTVYRAQRRRCGTWVALRVLHPEVHADPVRRETFLETTRRLGAVRSPGLASLVEVIAEPSVTGAATRLLEGETLADRLLRGPLGDREARRVGAAVTAAVEAAHAAGAAHGDLGPSSVYLENDGGVRVLDFGLAPPVGLDDARKRDRKAIEDLAAAIGLSRPAVPGRPVRPPVLGPRAAPAVLLVACVGLATGVVREVSPGRGGGDARPVRTTLAVLPLSIGGPLDGVAPADPGLTVTDAIITRLAQSALVDVRPTHAIAGFADDPIEPVAAGRVLGVQRVLSGELTAARGAWQARLRLDDVRTGDTIWVRTIDSNEPDFEAARRRISEGVVTTITSEMASTRGGP